MDPMLEGASWLDEELAGSTFADARLGQRLRRLLEQLGGAMGASLPLACQDWAATKAAYRFFDNDRVSEAEILAGHFAATASRVAATEGPILILHDTTEFTYHRVRPEPIGVIGQYPCRNTSYDRRQLYTVCGLLMHSSLGVTPDGLPLGLCAIKFWTRASFKGTTELKRHINPTRVPIEDKESLRWLENMRQSSALVADPARCIHIGDRESDIYELFVTAHELGTHFLVRSCVDRRADDGTQTIIAALDKVPGQGEHWIVVRDDKGKESQAHLTIKYHRLQVLPPLAKRKRYPALALTVICADEQETPENRQPIHWRLITDLPVTCVDEAIETIGWYALRWKIELFHKILKSGCRAEEAKLRSAERLVNLLALFCILAWRVFWLTMLNRTAPQASPRLVLTALEIRLLDQLVKNKTSSPAPTLAHYLTKIARLGGYLARAKDPPPGTMVMWRGLSRLTDIELGASLGMRLVGN
ncbi:MAG: IS4 family transposase [Microvirga sp.]